jgi:hypothetical protein
VLDVVEPLMRGQRVRKWGLHGGIEALEHLLDLREWRIRGGWVDPSPKQLWPPGTDLHPWLVDVVLAKRLHRVTLSKTTTNVGLVRRGPEALGDLPFGQMDALLPFEAEWSLTVFLERLPPCIRQQEQGAPVGPPLQVTPTEDIEMEPDLLKLAPMRRRGGVKGEDPLKDALASAQRRWPYTLEIAQFLEKVKPGKYLSDRKGLRAVEFRARECSLSPEGLVLIHSMVPEGVPIIPPVQVREDMPEEAYQGGTERALTWREWLLAQAHEPLPGQHLRPERMLDALNLIAWWDSMTGDAEKWQKQCRICCSRLQKPRISQPLKTLSAMRPFTVLVYDLVFVTPHGEHGEIGCLSAICPYTKYLWLRTIWGASAQEAAWALFSVICDAGVVPMRLLSDRDRAFRTRVLLEFTALLRARQSFSMAWSPEGHGVVERAHREFHKDVGRAIESVAGAHAAMWPRFVPLAETVWRSKPMEGNVTPYAMRSGFFGTSPLASFTSAVASIPRGMPHTTWVRSIQAAHSLLCQELDAGRQRVRDAHHGKGETIRPRTFSVGEYVLLSTPNLGVGGKLQARGTGPWRISAVDNQVGSVELTDPFTGAQKLDELTGVADRINMNRLLRFEVPEAGFGEEGADERDLGALLEGQLVAWQSRDGVSLLRTTKVVGGEFVDGVQEVERDGRWTEGEESCRVLWRDLLCRVRLDPSGQPHERSKALLRDLCRERGIR